MGEVTLALESMEVTLGQEDMEVGSLAATPGMEVTPALEAMEVIQGVTLALEVVSCF